MMLSKPLSFLLLATTGLAALPAAAAPLQFDTVASGAVSSAGQRTPNILEGTFRNNYFVFDLTSAPEAASLSLTVFANGRYQGFRDQDSVMFSLFAVSDATRDVVAANTGGEDVYTDLGDGSVFGSVSVATPGTSGTMPALTIDLDAALGAFNAARGGLFAFGGSSGATGSADFLWLSSNTTPVARLDVAPVPLPAALPLMLVALGGLAATQRARRA